MKRFRFRLESVRALRALAETAARERFGAAQMRLAAAREAFRLATKRRMRLAEEINAARASAFRPSEQTAALAALGTARLAEHDAARAEAGAVSVVETARGEWLAARRRLQVVQRLEERARRAHQEAADRAEQAQLDELAALAAARLSSAHP